MARDTTYPGMAPGTSSSGAATSGGSIGAASGSSSSSAIGDSLQRKRSQRSVRNRTTSAYDGGAHREPPTPESSSLHTASFASPPPASLTSLASARPPETPGNEPVTTPSGSNFTPATGVQVDTRYILADAREWTRKNVYEANRQRSEGLAIFEVDVGVFFSECMPCASSAFSTPEALEVKSKRLFTKKKVPSTNGEAKFYEAILESGIFQAPESLIPKDTHLIRGSDINDPDKKYSPDFALLREDVSLNMVKVLRARLILQNMEICGDQKGDDEDPMKDSDKGREAFGQLITYTEVVTSNSHRTHMFGFLLMPEYARLLRFDHSGIIVTKRFLWRTSGIILSFFDRSNVMTGAERGWNPSVSLISPDHALAQRARELLEKRDQQSWSKLQGALPRGISPRDVLPTAPSGKLSLFHVYDEHSHVMHRIVTHHPSDYDAHGYLGHAGRSWLGIDLERRRVVQIKAYWRDSRSGIPSESQIHRRFREGKNPVEYTLEFGYGGDIPVNAKALWDANETNPIPPREQARMKFITTRTYDFSKKHADKYKRLQSQRGAKAHSSVEMVPRVYHVAVFYTPTRKLSSFINTKELVQAFRDAIIAIGQASDRNIVHRNLTASSIGIDKDGHGRVMHWDSTGEVDRSSEFARQKSRMVSWQFVAAALLLDPHARDHLLRDDLESILYLLYFHVLAFRPPAPGSALRLEEILLSLRNVFEYGYATDINEIRGGRTKQLFLGGGADFRDIDLETVVRPSALFDLMRQFRTSFQPLYITEPRLFGSEDEEEEAQYEQKHNMWSKELKSAITELSSTDTLLELFDEALSSSGWPSSDGAIFQFGPRAKPSTGLQAFTGNRINSYTSGRSSVKRTYEAGPGTLISASKPSSTKRTKSSHVKVVTGSTTRVPQHTAADGEAVDDGSAEADAMITEEDIFLGLAH
ncbi:hypothetical protein PENSPDRAFT_739051 [Peniophora sp. CONT]|nr:hypothetical protein PENSPDRAFT_739051 [Peniophora sp. CONT]